MIYKVAILIEKLALLMTIGVNNYFYLTCQNKLPLEKFLLREEEDLQIGASSSSS
jgi:hypothetical protein